MLHRGKEVAVQVLFWTAVAGFIASVAVNRAGDLIYAIYRRKAT